MENIEKPNYRWWAKMEVWTLKQAALLLHGMDPHKYRSLKPYVNNLPPEYADLQKTYFVLHQFPWEETYSDYYYRGKGIHPVAIVHLAITQKLPLPKRLKKWVAERFHRETSSETDERDIPSTFAPYASAVKYHPPQPTIIQKNFGFTARERKNLLRGLGILVLLLFDDENSSPRYFYANKLNAYQIMQTIIEKAQRRGINTKGLKSLDRKITEALALLEAEQDQ
jgi:hypothetical protein